MLCYSTTVICKISDMQMAKPYFILLYARYCTIVVYTLLWHYCDLYSAMYYCDM